MVILDTCALIEAFKVKPSFSAETYQRIEAGAVILSISLAEIACKIKLGKLEMSLSARNLHQKLKQIESIQIVDIGVKEWLDSIDLQWEENKDPADRMITAFAINKNYSIVTTDQKIKKFYNDILW